MPPRKRLGIFGGTFDPIHVGHLVVADNARFELNLDEVLFVVAGDPWQKRDRTVTDAEVRFQAVDASLDGLEGFSVSRTEVDREGPSYMADTLEKLAAADPHCELFLILGTDAAARLETWSRWREVAERAEVIVVNRPGTPRVDLDPSFRVHHVEIPPLDISSTDLRFRLENGRPVAHLIPAAALRILRR